MRGAAGKMQLGAQEPAAADDDAVRILYGMKAEQASLLLDTLSQGGATQARRAAAITKRMRNVLPAEPAK